MEHTLKQAVHALIETRIEEAAVLKFKQTHQYVETAKEIKDDFEQLKASFATENQIEMLLALEAEWKRQQALSLAYAYRQGVKDSIVLQDVLKKYELEWNSQSEEGTSDIS